MRFSTTVPLIGATLALSLLPAAPAHAGSDDAGVFPYPDAELTLVNHRGLSPGFPENTLAAYANSVELGVDAIEIDLRPTADGEIVILHDETVDRTTDGTGPVSELTLAEVKALDAGSYVAPEFAGEQVPTYAEALEAVADSDVQLLLDIKDSALVSEIVEITEEHDMADRVIVGPRDVDALKEFQQLDPDLTTLGFIEEPENADAFIEAGVDYIRLWPEWITESRDSAACRDDYAARVEAFGRGEREHPGSASCLVEEVTSQGTPVWSTVNDAPRATMDELLRLGATGLLSDLPDELDGLLETIDRERHRVAAAGVRDLSAEIEAVYPRPGGPAAAERRWAKQAREIRTQLDRRAHRAILDGRDQHACSVLGTVEGEIDAAGFPRAEAWASQTRGLSATLACSRF